MLLVGRPVVTKAFSYALAVPTVTVHDVGLTISTVLPSLATCTLSWDAQCFMCSDHSRNHCTVSELVPEELLHPVQHAARRGD